MYELYELAKINGMHLNYICGLGRLSVCKYFIPESQTD